MSIFEILNPTSTPATSTPATSTEATSDLATEVAKLNEKIAALALQTTDPAAYREMMEKIAEQEKKEKAAKMFDSMTMDEQKALFSTFKKSAKSKSVTSKDVKAEIAKQILDVEAMGVKDTDKQKVLASMIMGFDVNDNKAIAAEVERRNEEAMANAVTETLEELDTDYKMFEMFAKMFK